MSTQTEPIRWEHRIICNRCGRGKRLRNEEECVDWSEFIREHGWREDDGYPRRHTCPECITSEVPGVAQQVEGGVWHRYDLPPCPYCHGSGIGSKPQGRKEMMGSDERGAWRR